MINPHGSSDARHTVTFVCSGNLTGSEIEKQLAEYNSLRDCCQKTDPDQGLILVFDLARAKMVDAGGIGFIVDLLTALKKGCGKMVIKYSDNNVYRTLRIFKIDQRAEFEFSSPDTNF